MAKQPSNGRKTTTKSKKPAANAKKPDESIKAETLIDAIPPEVHEPAKAQTAPVKAEPKEPQPTKPTPTPPKAEEPKPKVGQSAPEKVPAASPATAPAPAQRSGGFFPLLLGGLIAGILGFGAATLLSTQTDTSLTDQIAAQSASIDSLQNQVASIPELDLSGIEAAQAELATNLDSLQAQMTEDLNALDSRIADLESLPTGEGTVSDRAIAAYEAELENLRAEMEQLTGTARAQLDEARAEAAAIEENAAAAARAAAGRAALARIQTSLDSGEPLGAALGDLEDAIQGSAPDALLAAESGVPTLVSLQEEFPEVAGAALAAARSAGVAGEETTGVGAFLRNQFEVRSTVPREGNDVDAILSRAEAAVKAGRLSDALAEIAALPEEARVEMTDWLGRAETRAAAINAVDTLSTTLNDN